MQLDFWAYPRWPGNLRASYPFVVAIGVGLSTVLHSAVSAPKLRYAHMRSALAGYLLLSLMRRCGTHAFFTAGPNGYMIGPHMFSFERGGLQAAFFNPKVFSKRHSRLLIWFEIIFLCLATVLLSLQPRKK